MLWTDWTEARRPIHRHPAVSGGAGAASARTRGQESRGGLETSPSGRKIDDRLTDWRWEQRKEKQKMV